jgi:hypothetical protein
MVKKFTGKADYGRWAKRQEISHENTVLRVPVHRPGGEYSSSRLSAYPVF